MASLVFSVITASLMLILYLRQSHISTGSAHIRYPAVGFWWSIFALTWALMLIMPYLAYFLRANGWCAACCGGHQQYHLSSLFKSVFDEGEAQQRGTHPGKKRPLLSNGAKLVLHVFMLILGFFITITSLISFICYVLTLKDGSGGIWSFVTFVIGATYMAVIAFVFMQLRVRDRKRELVASHPRAVTRALSDTDDVINRWDAEKIQSDYESAANASDTDFLLSDSDARHLYQTGAISEREMVARTSLNSSGSYSSLTRPSMLSYTTDGSRTDYTRYGDEETDDGLVGEPGELAEEISSGDVDLDENILASQMSGHSPFQVAKQDPDSSCANSIGRAFVVFGFVIIAALVVLIFSFQMLATYQAISMSLETHTVPPLGRFYAGGDYNAQTFKLHLYCEGAASSILTPTVLIETDWASVSYEWGPVTRRLLRQSNQIRICRYDRGGYGWSDPSPAPRDARSASQQLSKILTDAGEVGPLVMVSSGFGTYISRIFTAHTRRHTVAALILIDALHEKEQEEFAKAWEMTQDQEDKMEQVEKDRLFQRKFLAPLGIPRLQMKASRKLNAVDQSKQIAAKAQLAFPDAVLSEFGNMYGASREQVIASRKDGFGDLPLTLIVSMWRLNGTCAENRVPVDKCRFYEDSRDKLGDIPIELQEDLLTLSSNSELLYAEESAYAHLDQPTFVAETIMNTIRKSYNVSITPDVSL